MVVGLVLRDRRGRPLVKIDCVLGQPSQPIHVEVIFGKETRQKVSVTTAVREMRKSEVAPRIDVPVPVAIVDNFNGWAVEVRKILVKISGAPQGLESGSVLAVLPVKSHLRHRQVIVSGGRA